MPKQVPKDELDTKAGLKNAIAANKALAELKGAGDVILNHSGRRSNAVLWRRAREMIAVGPF